MMHCQNVTDKPDLTHDGNLRGPVGYSTMGLSGSNTKAYDNKAALLKSVLKTVMDPPLVALIGR